MVYNREKIGGEKMEKLIVISEIEEIIMKANKEEEETWKPWGDICQNVVEKIECLLSIFREDERIIRGKNIDWIFGREGRTIKKIGGEKMVKKAMKEIVNIYDWYRGEDEDFNYGVDAPSGYEAMKEIGRIIDNIKEENYDD